MAQTTLSRTNFRGPKDVRAIKVPLYMFRPHWASVYVNIQPSNSVFSLQIIITKTRLFKYIEISLRKTESFQIKILIFYHISAQNIDCGYSLEPPRRGGSNEYPQSMFLSRNKKNNVYLCIPQFYYIKVGFKGVKIS